MNGAEIPANQKVFIIITGLVLLCIVIELVRRRKMLEQYSALWILIGVLSVIFVWLYPLVEWITALIGAGWTTSTILFGATLALLLLNLQICVKISEFQYNIKDIVQELAMLADQVQKMQENAGRRNRNTPVSGTTHASGDPDTP
ncbi:MAG TPA: DUF2304 domain-containing protein [bacterium]|nr:DUF2304 domain-containing protein [Candidatus Omnitrophota bacterium]HOJ60956.1 DUF2304 domain-containing protein [bacterium]